MALVPSFMESRFIAYSKNRSEKKAERQDGQDERDGGDEDSGKREPRKASDELRDGQTEDGSEVKSSSCVCI